MTARIIPSFTGIHHFLSNGHEGDPFTIEYPLGTPDGQTYSITYATGEHCYQAHKASTPELHEWVNAALKPFGPDGAKKRGRSVHALNWEARRLDVMQVVLDHKFASPTLMAHMLLDTGDAELIEGNTWGDHFWGVCDGYGSNWLGTLLMARRAVLRSRR